MECPNEFPSIAGSLKLPQLSRSALRSRFAGLSNPWVFRFTAGIVHEFDAREAVQHGIDRQRVVDDVHTDSRTVAAPIFTPGCTDLSDQPTSDPQASARLLDESE